MATAQVVPHCQFIWLLHSHTYFQALAYLIHLQVYPMNHEYISFHPSGAGARIFPEN